MTSASRITNLAPIGCAVASLFLASCALPPKQAWQKIRSDGLISYISYEMRTPRHPLGAPGPVLPIGPASKPVPNGASGTRPLIAKGGPATTPLTAPVATKRHANADPGTMSPPEGTLTAAAVPALPGYVRSPYTNPPRLIEVKEASPGATMICPYTLKPFIIPSNLQTRSEPVMATRNKPERTPVSPPSPTVTPRKDQPNSIPEVALKDLATLPQSSPSSTPSGNMASQGQAPGNTAPQSAAPKPAEDIPYGSPIVGRPGYVNSPHAASNQLVDVTGLPVGMEVKCPYTGKVFRVPPQDVAASKPATPPSVPAEDAGSGSEKK